MNQNKKTSGALVDVGGPAAWNPETSEFSFPEPGIDILLRKVSGTVRDSLDGGGILCEDEATLAGDKNTYTGTTIIRHKATLHVSKLDDGNRPSSIGASFNSPGHLLISGKLDYIGTEPSETDRLFTVNSSHDCTISNSSEDESATIRFTNHGKLRLGNSNNTRELTLGGSNRGKNRIDCQFHDNGKFTSKLIKKGEGTWVIGGWNTHSGGTVIREGTLIAENPGALGRGDICVEQNATLIIRGSAERPAFAGPGKVIINGNLKLNSAFVSVKLAAESTYIFNGTLDLNNAFNALPAGRYPIISGGAGPGRYVDNLSKIIGYDGGAKKASFAQGVVIISDTFQPGNPSRLSR